MAGPLYRSRAMKAMESHEDIERLLPVTSWRLWLAAVAGGLLVVASVLYAAADTRAVTVAGDGRITDGSGVRLVSSTVAGQLSSYEVEGGQTVEEGQVVAYVRTGDELVPQRTEVAGRVIGSLWRPGDPIKVGMWLLEVAATETDGLQALIALPVEQGQQVREGQTAVVTVTGALGESLGKSVPGTVLGVTEPLRAVEVEVGLALLEPPTEKQIVVGIGLDEPLEPGSEVNANITISERNLLQQMLGLS